MYKSDPYRVHTKRKILAGNKITILTREVWEVAVIVAWVVFGMTGHFPWASLRISKIIWKKMKTWQPD